MTLDKQQRKERKDDMAWSRTKKQETVRKRDMGISIFQVVFENIHGYLLLCAQRIWVGPSTSG